MPTARVLASGVALAFALLTRAAHGQTTVEAAARAKYDVGAAAYEAKDFARAARFFTEADDLAPNPVVLKLALAAATQADDAVLSMTLALRAETRVKDGSVTEVVRHARSRFEGRVGTVRIVCAAAGTCRATVAGRPAADRELVVVATGEVDAVIESGTRTTRMHVTVLPRGEVDLVEPPAVVATTQPPPATAPPPAPTESGLPAGVFWGGVVLTGALGVATVASGVDTLAKHDTYAESRSSAARERGVGAETLTNVLLATALTSAVVTGVVGLFFTHWRAKDASLPAARAGEATIRF